jgi:hypothetical protein
MAIDPARFEQFFRRSSSGDWVYVGYGLDPIGRVVSSYDREWLLGALPVLSRWKRVTVVCFSAPFTWVCALVLNTVTHLPGSRASAWVFEHRALIGVTALSLLLLFIVATAVLTAHPTAREFARRLANLPKDDAIGIERFVQNVGAVNGPWVTLFLMSGFGVLLVPGAVSGEMWPYFLPFSLVWVWFAWHMMAGAVWKPSVDEP